MGLTEVAQESDAAVRAARARLVDAVREAHRSGMTQQQIGRAIGRSQPEVSRLIHFHGTTPLAKRLIAARQTVVDTIRAAGGRNVRVFGSVAAGADTEDSDVDLLFDMQRPLGLMALERIADQVAAHVGADIDLVPIQALRPDVRDRVLAEAVPL